MPEKNYGGEDSPDLSRDTLTEISPQEDGDTLSHTLSPCYGSSNNPTPPTRGLYSYGTATAEAVKLSTSSAEPNALVPLVEVKKEVIRTGPPSEIHADMLLLPDFASGPVGKIEAQNGMIVRLSLHNFSWLPGAVLD
ncbi:hypothetical protein L873DRAFT_1824191 [Choiromyces venosus 120613-1]|uniref:Uncharacterized protein n=1 Tax=Choiromyces venosus 120613-1 TaxID=1336337 RepID=A0A3N4ISE9_9PEZI|nr:hypothetical protein L873DRAFT_1824191 [Choiromyces venosus 120613-1]